MAAKDALSTRLFHGSAREIEGGVVVPSEVAQHYGEGAYATSNLTLAQHYAEGRANREGTLFGTVYEVEPESEAIAYHKDNPVFTDLKGFRVKQAVSYPINPYITSRGEGQHSGMLKDAD